MRRWWHRPTAPLLFLAAVKFAIHLATNGVYGFQRDEMYYVTSGQHPALGYVDYPPVTPMLAWLNTSIFGISPWTLRLFPALAGAAVVFLAGIVAAVLVSRDLRPLLRTRYPWVGFVIAMALFAPNIAWQIANDFPSLTYIRNHSADISNSGGALTFTADFLLYIGPLILPLWVAGLLSLLRDQRLRPMGVLTVVAILLLLPEGKAYYPAPTIPLVLAAGCIAVGRIVSMTRRRRVTGLVVAGGVIQLAVLLPVILPVVPTSSLHTFGLDKLRQDFADTVGWPDLASQVAAVYNGLPGSQRATSSILASNYGEAGAVDIYGGSEHLPQAISPHLTFWYWKPANLDATTLVTVGFNPSDIAFLCGTVTRAGTVVMPDSVINQEAGTPILICAHLRESINAAWSSLRSFS